MTMGLYRYTALTETGRKSIGLINADSLERAKERLRRQKILVTKLVRYKKQGGQFVLSPPLLLRVTHDVHVLLKAGLPLYDVLHTLEEKYRCTKMHPLLLDLCDQVKRGRRFSDALKDYPKIFDSVYIALLQAGEESGTLMESFGELAKFIHREQALKKVVKTAMIYPAFLGIFCLGIMGILLLFLIPSMAEIFEDRALHPITQMVLGLSDLLRNHALSISLGIGGATCAFFLYMRHPKGKKKVKKLLLHVPIVKKIFVETIMARFSRVFSVLFSGGIPLLECMYFAKEVVKYSALEEVITQAQVKVAEGKRLSEELAKSPLIPLLVIRMLAIAEESGQIAEMMGHLSHIYEEHVEQSLKRVTTLLQPTMLLFLGIIIAIILLSVLLPLTDMSSLIQ